MRRFSTAIVLLLVISVSAETAPDFTGHWQQQTSSGGQRQLEVEQKGRDLRVKTVITNSEGARSFEVKYEIGGPETVYQGLDGDEFHSSVHWQGSDLIFETIEHEAGSEIPQKTVWTISADRHTLQVEREVIRSGKTNHTSTSFVRQP
jgi:hypothetical protein